MNAYFDTSAFLPLILPEATTPQARDVWRRARRIVSVRLLYPEARAGLAFARRIGRVDATGVAEGVAAIGPLIDRIGMVDITEAVARRAGTLADERDLRGCDAVHLAAAELYADAETVFVAGDRALCAAARRLGLAVAELRS